jgi:hypothetical protein
MRNQPTVSYRREIPWTSRLRFDADQVLDHISQSVGGADAVSHALFLTNRRVFKERLISRLRQSGAARRIPIERVSKEEFDARASYYLSRKHPVVIAGGAKQWNCCRTWSFDELQRRYGNDDVKVLVSGDELDTTFGAVIDMIEARLGHYLTFLPLFERHPELLEDLDVKWLYSHIPKFTFAVDFQVFMGHERTMTRFHNNIRMNLFIQVIGRKKWVFYPNYYRPVLSPRLRQTARYPEHDEFDPFDPEPDEIPPGYPYIDAFETTLQAGDILFNAPYVWHAVKNDSLSVGVGFRWIDLARALASCPLYAFLDIVVRWPPFLKLWMLYRAKIIRATFDKADEKLNPLAR